MRGRGIDFEHRFNTSRWAEDLLIEALGKQHGLLTVRFGLSEVRPDAELEYGIADFKEPDLLVFRIADLQPEEVQALTTVDLVAEPRASFEPAAGLHFAFRKVVAALEVEFSPYRAKEMAGRNWQPRTAEQWDRRPLKNANPPTAPNVFIKEEDLPKLMVWERKTAVPIVVAHLFDQEGFAVSLDRIVEFNGRFETSDEISRRKLQVTTGIFKTIQVYDRVDAQGARERKTVFRVSPAAAIKIGDLDGITVSAQVGVSSSKKYVAHTLFTGGHLEATAEFLEYLQSRR